MRKKRILFTAVLGGLFLIFPKIVLAANTDIVINEIGAYEPSGYEWVEIYNKGIEPIDVASWKFWEDGTNHKLTAVEGKDSIVSPGEYAIIAQDAIKFLSKYPSVSGSVFDSSWSSLKEAGEEIGLKDGEENIIEVFTYLSAPNFSLERKNYLLSDYSANNWQENASGNTVGLVNGVANSSAQPAEQDLVQNSDASLTVSALSPKDEAVLWQKIKINEFMPDPESGNEWVELYNTGVATLDLTGGLICDARETTSTCKTISGTIASGGWLVVDVGARFLNNAGDGVILKNALGGTINVLVYGEDDLEVPKKGQSLARQTDGSSAWIIQSIPTPGQANKNNGATTETTKITPVNPVPVSVSPPTTSIEKVSSLILSELDDESADSFVAEQEIIQPVSTKNTNSNISTKSLGAVYSSGILGTRNLSAGAWVKARGVVVVEPGVFGSQYFYINDENSGIQIYQYKKDFPPIKVGDLVEVSGYISSARGAKKINVKNSQAIDILSLGNAVSTSLYNIEELGEEGAGMLVKISGEITEIKTSYMYLDNGESEIKVYFKQGAKIDKTKFVEGELAEVTGVLEMGGDDLQIWPRSERDIFIVGPSADLLKKQEILSGKESDNKTENYFLATLGGALATLLAFVARSRALFIKEGAKKAVEIAVRLIRRG